MFGFQASKVEPKDMRKYGNLSDEDCQNKYIKAKCYNIE